MNFLVARPEQIIESASQKVIRELERARYSIWIANILFTDNNIHNLLIEKLKEGVNVEIISNKNKYLDCNELAKIEQFIDAGGEFFIIDETSHIKMWDKGFCMLDYATVIDDLFEDKSYLKPGFSTFFLREYPETLIEHYINQYFFIKNNYCINRYS